MADVQEVRPTDDSVDAAHTAAVVTELSLAMHQILQVHPSLCSMPASFLAIPLCCAVAA